ncbi:pyrophosphatase PpaX [Paenibacillus sp.]|uniref:pyrophosphatase PpaX n=1 Tax=Paenibacillus sp. TaxID=58172 RepID=UPI002D3ACA98|nr:pyrophosphatase PpaX [Paenibacillus sp.]HZG55286.1 pyrophosphatase PpaX [Paenibacillus sp.]
MIRTVLFDLDGTILDTNELIFRSFEYVWERKGWPMISRETLTPYMGNKLHDMFRETAGMSGDEDVEELIGLYREYNWAHHDALVRGYPHVVEVMAELRGAGVRMGVVTTKIRKTSEMGLKLCGMDGFIEHIVSLDDVTHAKPHPEPVQKALAAMGAAPEETLMVGDSAGDLLAARAAGVRSAAVAWSIKSKEDLMRCEPDYWIEDIRELPAIVSRAKDEAR